MKNAMKSGTKYKDNNESLLVRRVTLSSIVVVKLCVCVCATKKQQRRAFLPLHCCVVRVSFTSRISLFLRASSSSTLEALYTHAK